MEKRLTTMSDIKELKDEELEMLNGGRKDREKSKAYKKKKNETIKIAKSVVKLKEYKCLGKELN